MRNLIQFKVGDWVVPREDRKTFWHSLNEDDGPYFVLEVHEKKGWPRRHAFEVRCGLPNCNHEYSHNQHLVLLGLRVGRGACGTFFRKVVMNHDCEKDDRKLPIDRPCSACSAGDYTMEFHSHCPPFRFPAEDVPEESRPTRKFRKVL